MSHQNIVIIRNAAPQDFGGGERFPVFLSQVLYSKGFNPLIISRSNKLLEFAKQNDIKTLKGWWWSKQQWSGVNNLIIPLYFFWQFILFMYYLGLFLKLKPLAIHIQSKDDFIAATYAGKLLRKRVIWTDHADLKHVWKNITVWYKNPIGKIILKAARKADAITVVSKSEYNLVSENLPKSSNVLPKIKVIYNGVVNVSTLYKKQANEDFVFLVASRLVTDKGIHEVVDAFNQLHKKYKKTKLRIIGDGPERNIFEEKVRNNSAIELLGHQSEPLTFMATSNAFVHPTYHEGFSVALVEAGMMSLPIIATAVGGNVEIIKNNITGLLIEPKKSEELMKAMEKVLTDEKLRTILATNAHAQYIKHFQFDAIVENDFIPLYKGVS